MTWEFQSKSNPDTTHHTMRSETGALTCTCTGFRYRRGCRHVTQVATDSPVWSDIKAAALRYQAAGYHVIPVTPRGKRPLVSWKRYQRVQPTRAQIETWWTSTPDANVAIVLGQGRFAVDLDGGELAEDLLRVAGIELPEDCPRSRTGNGHHVFFSAPRDQPDRVGMLRGLEAQIDIRGRGIVIVPPSVHESGRLYKWEHPLVSSPPPAPAGLLALISQIA